MNMEAWDGNVQGGGRVCLPEDRAFSGDDDDRSWQCFGSRDLRGSETGDGEGGRCPSNKCVDQQLDQKDAHEQRDKVKRSAVPCAPPGEHQLDQGAPEQAGNRPKWSIDDEGPLEVDGRFRKVSVIA